MFSLSKAGKYKVKLTFGETLAETEIKIIAATTTDTVAFNGKCQFLWLLSRNPPGAVKVEGQVVVSKGVVGEKDLWFANIKGNKMSRGSRERGNLFNPVSVPADTKIEAAQVDFKGQLWSVLESHGNRSLLIWKLVDGSVQTPIPWGKDKIEMATTRASMNGLGFQIVIAGVPGKLKMSSLNLALDGVHKSASN